MKSLIPGVLLLILLATVPLQAAISDKRAENLAASKELDVRRLQTYRNLPGFMIRPGLLADRTGRVVRITAESIALKANDPVEFTLITAGSGKDYEALAVSFASALDIHEALRFIGLTPGHGADASKLRFWPKGDHVKMTFHYTEPSRQGREARHVSAETLVFDKQSKKPLPSSGFVFIGSERLPAAAPATGTVYAADAFSPSSIASLYNESYAVLDVPRRAAQHEVYTFQVPNPDILLPAGQLIEITMEPLRREVLPDWVDLTLVVSNGVAALPAYTLLDSLGQPLNTNRTINGTLAALNRFAQAQQDPFVTVQPADDISLATVQKAAQFVDSIDCETGIRADAPPPGHPFFRAFLPKEQFKDRNQRPAHAAELLLSATNGVPTGELVFVETEWKDDAPVHHETRVPMASAKQLKEAMTLRGDEAPRVVLVYAPATMLYGTLRGFLAPLVERKTILYVFLK